MFMRMKFVILYGGVRILLVSLLFCFRCSYIQFTLGEEPLYILVDIVLKWGFQGMKGCTVIYISDKFQNFNLFGTHTCALQLNCF